MSQKEPIFEYLESIAEFVPIPFYWLDIDRRWMGLNKKTVQALGVNNKKEIIGKTILETFPDVVVANDLDEWMLEILCNKTSSQKETRSLDLSTGKYKYWLSTYDPIYNQIGELTGLLGTSIEITAEKEALLVMEEFKKLKHERDLESIRSEAHKNKIMQEFGVIAAKVAHDISSPLMVANSSLYKLETSEEYNGDQISLIKQSLSDIKNISGKILTTYREITGSNSKVKLHKVDDGNIKRYVLLSSLLENQIGFKKIEWQANPCKLEISINDKARNIFAYVSPTEFNRSFSNLLNNAYESLSTDNRNITVELDSNMDSSLRWNDRGESCHLGEINDSYENNKDKSYHPCGGNDPSVNDRDTMCHPRAGEDPYESDKAIFTLKIKDTGCGIPEDKIANVLSGESSKHEGLGMGLSGAKAYFESIAGELKLNSEINQGTEVTIEFPIANDPAWFDRSITYTPDTRIVILDDSSTIIMLWQRVLSDLNLKCNYFMNVDDFMQWYDTQEDKGNIILFADYDLGNENFTGLDVVTKVKDIRSYLVTNHSEEAWLQEIIKNNNLKLLPKKIIEHLKFDLT